MEGDGWGQAQFHHVVQGHFDPRGCGLKWEPLAAVNGRLSTSGCDFSKNMFFGQEFQDTWISYTAHLPCICRMVL